MNTDMHGKKIREVIFPIEASGQQQTLRSGENGRDLSLSATFHGDRDEFWIVSMVEGVEVARFNPRHVETIVWENAAPTT